MTPAEAYEVIKNSIIKVKEYGFELKITGQYFIIDREQNIKYCCPLGAYYIVNCAKNIDDYDYNSTEAINSEIQFKLKLSDPFYRVAFVRGFDKSSSLQFLNDEIVEKGLSHDKETIEEWKNLGIRFREEFNVQRLW